MGNSVAPAGTLSARVVVRIVEFAVTRGHDGEAMCRSVGLALPTLRDPNARIPYALAERLGMRVVELTRDVNIGLHLAADVRSPAHYDPGLLMMMASPTLRESLTRMARYQRYWGDNERVRLVAVAGGLVLRFDLPGAAGDYLRHSEECAAAEVVIGARVLLGREIRPVAVRFRHPAPPDTSEHATLFCCPLEFESAAAELELDDATLDAPLPHANEAFRSIFEHQVERALSRLPARSALDAEVRAAVQAALASGDCSLPGTASTMGISVRTLQRKLRDAGTSFADILDALRRELATTYLHERVSVQQIAWLLGYTDASAFHHAFKRWMGVTPEQFRATHALSG